MSKLGDLARADVVVAPHGQWGTLLVTGSDRRSWLEGLVTCELKQLGTGEGTWGLALNRLGKIQSVLWLVATADALWLAVAPGTLDVVHAEFNKMLVMEDAELEGPAGAHAWFALHGPQAAAKAKSLAALSAGYAAPIDWTGLGGAALVVPEARAVEVLDACQGQLLGEDDWTRLRLERGLPEFGIDFESSTRPHEAGLERRAVSWTKGCYLGQEVVCMQDMRGKVKRSLRVLLVSAPADADLSADGLVVDAALANVGQGSSRTFSERAGGWLVLARVELEATNGELRYAAGGDVTWPARLADVV